jgi:NAD(P)-dependent dehydrogenase (short-subunit alcohol dehydrogenase family)
MKRSPGIKAEFFPTDLSSPSQVRRTAAQIGERWPAIDGLINNAGARFDHYERTPENCERTFATNHLGAFLLTGLLLDRLAGAPAARIITVSSSAASQAKPDGRWQFEAHDFDRRQAYAKSKLANLLFAFELARRLHGSTVQSLAVDPGVVATGFARNNGWVAWLKHVIAHGRKLELRTPAGGADTLVFLATTPTLPPHETAGYFRDRKAINACPAAYDAAASAALWKLSGELTGVDPAAGSA